MKKEKKGAFAGLIGSVGLAGLAGSCGAACSAGLFPLAAFLSSLGLAGLMPVHDTLRIPILIGAALLGIWTIHKVNKLKNPNLTAITSVVITTVIAIGIHFGIKSTGCESAAGTSALLKTLTPGTQRIVKNGLYRQWMKLGRAPSKEQIASGASVSADEVQNAFDELKKAGFWDAFEPGTNNIRWFWPLSTVDHGVRVKLKGHKEVFARCAVDALGMSEMFGKIASIEVMTPHWKKKLKFIVDGSKIKSGFDNNVVVSLGRGCGDLLFFSSLDEYEEYKKGSGKDYLDYYTLEEGLRRGLRSFGPIFKTGAV